jgi:hypothetical protein
MKLNQDKREPKWPVEYESFPAQFFLMESDRKAALSWDGCIDAVYWTTDLIEALKGKFSNSLRRSRASIDISRNCLKLDLDQFRNEKQQASNSQFRKRMGSICD